MLAWGDSPVLFVSAWHRISKKIGLTLSARFRNTRAVTRCVGCGPDGRVNRCQSALVACDMHHLFFSESFVRSGLTGCGTSTSPSPIRPFPFC
jgi:hypothetical protein